MLCKIGEVEVWRILEMNFAFMLPDELYPNTGPEVGAEIERLAPGSIHGANGKLIIPVQGFLLKTRSHIILVDACVGNAKTNALQAWHMREDGRFMAALLSAGITPDDVDFVLCTHLHTDHTGWNTRLENGEWVPTFPNAQYLLPEADLAHYAAEPTPSYTESVLPVIRAGQATGITPPFAFDEGVELIPTPGHSPGHVSVRIRSEGREAIITGDAIHSSAQCWHPEWHFKFDNDPERAVTSRRYLLETASESAARVLGSHFTLPSIGRVQAKGDAFEWVAD